MAIGRQSRQLLLHLITSHPVMQQLDIVLLPFNQIKCLALRRRFLYHLLQLPIFPFKRFDLPTFALLSVLKE
jgi:hypothetical protein